MTSYPIVVESTLSLATLRNEIYQLISVVRPDWNASNTRLVTFTEGITNSILGLFNARTPNDPSEGLVIKLFGENTETFIDRDAEINAMTELSANDVLTQRVLIKFNNGLIYEFARGEACSRENMREEKIAKLIATKLAQFHNVPVKEAGKPFIITQTRKLIQLINDHQIKDVSELTADMDIIERDILPHLLPNPELGKDLVLCHNDLSAKNVIYDEQNETISFIDFEYAYLNYALLDVAIHFLEYAGVDNADFSLYPTRDEQKRWLKVYFQTRGIPHQPIDDNLCDLIDQFSAMANLMWGLWALVQSHLSSLDFDYLHYSQLRLDSYRKLRMTLFESTGK